jgi:hypothetical protein
MSAVEAPARLRHADYQPSRLAAIRSMDHQPGPGNEDEARRALQATLPPGWAVEEVRTVARRQWQVDAWVGGEERDACVSIRATSFQATIGALAICDVVSTLVERLPFDAVVEVYIGKQHAQPRRTAPAGAALPGDPS